MIMKFLSVSTLAVSLSLPAHALEIGVDADLGPVEADVSASVGDDSLAGVEAEVGIGETAVAGGGTGPGSTQPAGGAPTAATQKLLAAFVGKPVRSSDGAILGEIAEVQPTTKRCPLFLIDTVSSLKLDDKRIWLSTPRCDGTSKEMRLSMTRKAFLKKVN